MLRGKELREANRKLKAEIERADNLLKGINGANISERMNERSTILIRIEALRNKIGRSAGSAPRQVDYNISPASRINI